jgi:hypothetical protein
MKSYSIVGMSHRPGAYDILKALEVGETVKLVREPDNEYDSNAVAVWVGGTKVGYIPSKQNKALAAFIDQTGEPMIKTAVVDSAEPGGAWAKSISAKFVRSPNSAYPMVEVE